MATKITMSELSNEKKEDRPPTTIEGAFEQASKDIANAGFPGYVGKVFHPVREDVLLPLACWAHDHLHKTAILPDEIGSFSIHLVSELFKFGYSVLPHNEGVEKETNQVLRQELTEIGRMGMSQLQKPKPLISSMMGVIGFAANSVKDIVTLPFNGKLDEWATMTVQFFGYLLYAQVGKELVTAFGNPNGILNLAIVGNVQAAHNHRERCESRRARTAMDHLPAGMSQLGFKNLMREAARYVKYATAAYGLSMIDSADLLQVFGKDIIYADTIQNSSEAQRRRKIAQYINVRPLSIVDMTPPGGDIKLLGHFVSVDTRKDSAGRKNVVLAIRGTYTPSGLIIDAAAYSTKFCDGVLAHAGIAKRANTLWDFVKDTIVQELKRNPEYDLVITGHSLGAGAAALIAFKLNYENLLEKADPSLSGVKVKCYAFASPPVLFQACECKNEAVKDAMKNTYAFIHDNDCVPFMSVDSIRRLAKTVAKVDDSNSFKPVRRSLMAADQIAIPDNIVSEVMQGSEDLKPAADAERLGIPAPFVVWMRQLDEKDARGRPLYDAMFCRPNKQDGLSPGLNNLSILMDLRMISDHMNPQYERAVVSIVEQQIKDRRAGYAFPMCK